MLPAHPGWHNVPGTGSGQDTGPGQDARHLPRDLRQQGEVGPGVSQLGCFFENIVIIDFFILFIFS